MNYNLINRHPLDSQINFDEPTHTYTVNGRVFKSVTTIVEECFEQFDAEYWSKKKAPSLGLTPQQVKRMWEKKGEEARNLGTQLHEKIERYYLGQSNISDDTYRLFEKFTQLYHLSPYRTEWTIFDEDTQIAGTLDFLNFQNEVFTIYDWKRSNKVVVCGKAETYSKWGKKAFNPISHVPDTTYWHYALQVSIYRYILEKNYNIVVSKSNLAIFHPDYSQPYVLEVPYMRDEVIKLMANRKRQL